MNPVRDAEIPHMTHTTSDLNMKSAETAKKSGISRKYAGPREPHRNSN